MGVCRIVKRIFLNTPILLCLLVSGLLLPQFLSGTAIDGFELIRKYATTVIIGLLWELYLYGIKKIGNRISPALKNRAKSAFQQWLLSVMAFSLLMGLPMGILFFLLNLFVLRTAVFEGGAIFVYLLCPIGGFIGGNILFLVLLTTKKTAPR
jgi:hypothetical protein